MPDILDAQGLQVKTLQELRTDLDTGFRQIYGDTINLDQNSPDGQLIGIIAQIGIDVREKLAQIYNSFNPDRAIGRQLDERVVINNVARAGGTYTILDITLTVDRTVSLQGLDGNFADPAGVGYTVQDDAGTQFILVDSVTLNAGTYSLPFRAQRIGLVETVVGTITNPVTIVVGVTGINNSSAPTSLGRNEETDTQLRMRRQRSPANASQGYLDGLLGAVLTLEGVTDAVLYENFGQVVDARGIPPRCIWLVVEGGANTDIAKALYSKKSYGCDMKGEVEVAVERPAGDGFLAKFDRPSAQDLYVRFSIQRTLSSHAFNLDVIRASMVEELSFGIGSFAETSGVVTAAVNGIAKQGGGGVPISVEISDDGINYTGFLAASDSDRKWTLDASRIGITIV